METKLEYFMVKPDVCGMIIREKQAELLELLDEYPVVGLLGPRQVGKTTLAKQITSFSFPSVYLDLELPSDLAKLDNPSLFFNNYKDHLIILDEIQVRQDLFPILRALVDNDRKPGRFLLLGSASSKLMTQSDESLAGRIAHIDLNPIMLSEIGGMDSSINKHWLRGGFPLSYTAKSDRSSERWRQNFIRSYIEKDLLMLGLPNNPELLRRFWTMAAHMNGKLSNYNEMSKSLQVSNTTVKDYYDMFVYSFLIHALPPYFKNIKKRLVKSPKYFLNDTGILHSFLGISSFETLLGHPTTGLSWEAYVINQVRALISEPHKLYFYRTHQGAEIDLLITRGDVPFISCEIKLTNAPKVSKGQRIALNDIGTTENYIITHSSDHYPIAEHIEVISIGAFLERIKEL